MAAEFENFIQQELPRRPYVTTNPSQETIPVRRGPGPRQLEFVDIAEGEVLGKSGGVITGVSVLSISNCRGFAYEKPTAEAVWTIEHLQNTRNVQLTVYDGDGAIIFPDRVAVIDANTVQVSFAGAQDGRAVLVLFPELTPLPPPPPPAVLTSSYFTSVLYPFDETDNLTVQNPPIVSSFLLPISTDELNVNNLVATTGTLESAIAYVAYTGTAELLSVNNLIATTGTLESAIAYVAYTGTAELLDVNNLIATTGTLEATIAYITYTGTTEQLNVNNLIPTSGDLT